MSDKIYRTVTYEIEPSGDCTRCKARDKSYNHCMAFNDFILTNTAWNGDIKYYQLEKCKDYLSQEKQTRITFENVDSNILCNDKGEATMLNLYPLITAENRASVDEIYKTNKNVKVDVIVRWEK